jgi:hypothetical protein
MAKPTRRIIRLALGAITVVALLPSTVRAQATLGPAIAYHDDFKLGVGVGLNVPVHEFGQGVAILADFFYFFPDGSLSYLELNGNLTYSFALDRSPVTPFVLAGANVSNTADDFTDSSRTDVGLNLGGGLYFALGSVRPIVGAKIEIGGGRGFVAFGHLPFVIGR